MPQRRFPGYCQDCGWYRAVRTMTLTGGYAKRLCSECERTRQRRLSRQTFSRRHSRQYVDR